MNENCREYCKDGKYLYTVKLARFIQFGIYNTLRIFNSNINWVFGGYLKMKVAKKENENQLFQQYSQTMSFETVDSALFEEWVNEDAKAHCRQLSAYPDISNLKAINLVFLPPNTTKAFYRGATVSKWRIDYFLSRQISAQKW